PWVGVDQRRLGRSPRQRLDRESAGSAEEIEHAGAGEVAEHREDGLADLFGGRADLGALRGLDPAAAELSAGDAELSHYAASCSTRSSPKRRRASSSSGPMPGASSEPKRSRSSRTLRRASRSSAVSSGSVAARKRGKPCCRVPRISPSPRIV